MGKCLGREESESGRSGCRGPAGGPEVGFAYLSSVDLRRFQDAVIGQVDSLAFVSQGPEPVQLQEAPPAWLRGLAI